MKLEDLLAGAAGWRIEGDGGVEISGLSYDSRATAPGHLFFALARDGEQNRRNLNDALSRGAHAVVVRGGVEVGRPAVTIVRSAGPRLLMAATAARFFDFPSRRLELVGITGTSGKTTSSFILASIFEAAGRTAGIIGTIGAIARGRLIYRGLTTPESLDFETALVAMEKEGIKSVAAEVSSIGIVEGRVEELAFRACLFTNLGRDHLDYHGTMENYFAAKLRLFTEILPRSPHRNAVAVARGDDPFGHRILAATPCRKLSFGIDRGCDVHPRSWKAGLDGIQAAIRTPGGEIAIASPLLGEINLLNIMAAAAVATALGIGADAVAAGVRQCKGAPGRLEAVDGKPGVRILVDYAHKPDALEGVLRALRALSPGRIICVFGCGGDRDRGKRPLMGGIAARLSDVAVVTSDNPRSEDPLAIIAEIEPGLRAEGLGRIEAARVGAERGYLVEPDRRAAIGLGLGLSAPDDIVLIAGKGHEDYQLVSGRKLHFDDREVVRELLAGA